jgi:hypothetical protein
MKEKAGSKREKGRIGRKRDRKTHGYTAILVPLRYFNK